MSWTAEDPYQPVEKQGRATERRVLGEQVTSQLIVTTTYRVGPLLGSQKSREPSAFASAMVPLQLVVAPHRKRSSIVGDVAVERRRPELSEELAPRGIEEREMWTHSKPVVIPWVSFAGHTETAEFLSTAPVKGTSQPVGLNGLALEHVGPIVLCG